MVKASVADVASVVAALAAVFAAWWAFRGAQSTRDTYTLAAQQDASRNAGVALYYLDGRIHRYKPGFFRLYEMRLRITNLGDAPNGIVDLLLELELSRAAGPASHLALKNENAPRATDPSFREPPFTLPLTLAARTAVIGTAVFRASDELFTGMRVENYRVTAIDSIARRSTLQVIAINEQEHA